MLEIRKEYKFLLSNKELFDFISNKQLKKLYSSRKVTSMYMDSYDFKLFYNSELNDVDKFKIRYRYYSNQTNNLILEIKKNTSKGKFKEKINTSFNSFDEINYLNYKNSLYTPSLIIQYSRSYFSLENIRITIDNQITFKSCVNRTLSITKKSIYSNIVEFKLLNSNPDIEKFFPKNPVAFSKYNFGIEKVYNL